MKPGFSLALILIAGWLLPPCIPRPACAEPRSGVQEFGVTTGYGPSDRGNVKVIPLFLRAAWFLPPSIDEPLARRHLNLKWLVEPWIAGVTNHSDSVEFGVHPVMFRLDYDRGQVTVPFLEIGTGVMYTALQGLGLAGPFEFSSFGGAGLHLFVTKELAVTCSYRIRHISNLGLEHPNRGLNTHFFLIGLEKFPGRE